MGNFSTLTKTSLISHDGAGCPLGGCEWKMKESPARGRRSDTGIRRDLLPFRPAPCTVGFEGAANATLISTL